MVRSHLTTLGAREPALQCAHQVSQPELKAKVEGAPTNGCFAGTFAQPAAVCPAQMARHEIQYMT